MSTLKSDAITAATGTNTDLDLSGKGTGVPDIATGFKVGGTAGVPVNNLRTGTDGELLTWDASGDPATVAVGTATHILTSNGAGAAPTFQAAAGGGAWTLIATGTPSSSSTLDFTGFDSSTYDDYLFVVAGITNAGTHSEHRWRMLTSSDGGSSYDESSGLYAYGKRAQSMSGDNGAQQGDDAEIEFMGGMDTTGSGADGVASGYVRMPNPSGTTTWTRVIFDMSIGDSSTNVYIVYGMYVRKENAVVDAVRFYWLSEDFADAGAIYFYGQKKA